MPRLRKGVATYALVATLALPAAVSGSIAGPTDPTQQEVSTRSQLARERAQHRAFRQKVARELRRLHRLVRRYKVEYSRTVGYVSPRQNAWLCIHRYEGAWNDPNAPYYGGLQMDMNFQRAYGPEFLSRYGTADNWPWRIQILVADRAWKTRGFGPWPNTARMCGLR